MSQADNALTLRYRLSVLSRFCAAIFGGYFFTAYSVALLSLLIPTTKVDAVLYSVCASILIYSCIFIAVFGVRSQRWIWSSLVLSILGLDLLTRYIQGGI